jgi:ABC-type dipeptide/oligopeptide/nickel transport system permease component
MATVFAVSLAVIATYLGRGIDVTVRVTSFLALGIPPFWFGLISLIVFFEALGIAPGPFGRLSFAERPPHFIGLFVIDAIVAGQWTTAREALAHLALPAIALGLAPYGYVVRLLRANILDSSRAPHVRVALSKGITRWRAHRRHVVPNAILPTITASGLLLAQLLGGSVLVEKVFNWPGVGTLVVDAILRQDFAVVQAFILLSALIYVAVNLVVDVLYGMLDPRLRRT